MPLDASWMDVIPAAQPTAAMQMAQPAPPAWKPPPGAEINYVPTIDVTAAPHPGAAAGQPGSELAPSAASPPDAKPAPDQMAVPSKDWMDAIPAAKPSPAMDLAAGRMPATKSSGVLANMGAGTSEAVADTLGAPVDLATGAINLGLRGLYSGARAVTKAIGAPAPPDETPQITNPVGGSESIKSAEGLIGADPRNVTQGNQLDSIARGAGSGMASMMLPWAGARALPELAGLPGAVQRIFGAGGAPTMAAAGAAGGGLGQEAADSVPEPYKPLANLAGNMVGGAVPIALRAGAGAVTQAAKPLAQQFVAPMTKAGREGLAGQRIAGAATDAGAVRDALDEAAAGRTDATRLQAIVNDPGQSAAARAEAQKQLAAARQRSGELVPESMPTTFQLTGDQGLGNLERAVAKESPDRFNDRRGEQNAAQARAVAGLAQPGSSSEAVPAAFRKRLAEMDAAAEAETERLRGVAQGQTEGLGGAVPAGADQQATALQHHGRRIRAGLDALNQAERAKVSALYDAVDPDGTLAVDMSGIKKAAREIAKEIPKNAAPMEGDAGRLLGVAQMQKGVEPFAEVKALRSRITDAMREELYERGRSQTYRALSRLLAAVDDTLANGVEEAAGRDGNIAARLDALGEAPGGPVVGGRGGKEPVEAPGGGAAGVPGQGGTQGQGNGRPGSAGGNSAVAAAPAVAESAATESEPALTPNFDAAAAAKYRGANAEHAKRVGTYEEAPGVGPVLATGKRAGEWRLGDSRVASEIFNAGKGAVERIQAFLKAGGSNPALVSDVKDYAAFDLRRAAETPDGTLDPKKTAKWLKDHAEALRVFPDLAAKFRDAAQARAAMDEAMARHAEARVAFEKSAASHFLGDADPVLRVGKILRSDRAEATMAELADLTRGAPAAREGLKRAVVESMQQELRSNAEAGSTAERAFKLDTFQTFVRRAEPALKRLFSADEVQSIRNLAADMQRAQRSISGSKLPGGSNTAQDLAAGAKHGSGSPSVLATLVAAEAAGEAAQHAAGPLGRAVGMIMVPVANAMRQSGLKKVDELVTEAMLHPELARALLARVPAAPFAEPVFRNAARQILALSGVGAVRAK